MARCPKCNVRLENSTIASIPVRTCRECCGELVSLASLKVIERKGNPNWTNEHRDTIQDIARAADSQQGLRCTTCLRPMERISFRGYDGLQIDVCTKCELAWLDSGEIEKVQLLYEDRQANPDSPDAQRVAALGRVKMALELRQRRYEDWASRPIRTVGLGLGAPSFLGALSESVRLLRQEQQQIDEIDDRTVRDVSPQPPPAHRELSLFGIPLAAIVVWGVLILLALAYLAMEFWDVWA